MCTVRGAVASRRVRMDAAVFAVPVVGAVACTVGVRSRVHMFRHVRGYGCIHISTHAH